MSETLETVGAEVETQFIDNRNGMAISTETSQRMLGLLAERGWTVACRKNGLITTLSDRFCNQMFYELGRHNIELSTAAASPDRVIQMTYDCLEQLYDAGLKFGALPYFAPVLETSEDLLVIPDDRDATWLELDGRDALANLARTSSVQFTISVNPDDAMPILNRLGWKAHKFLDDYPQDKIWTGYIANSNANYQSDRYGGPLLFDALEDYCLCLKQHDVVVGQRLVPFDEVNDLNIPLFLRSIWWHFRLKRYDNSLCIEVRPMPRRSDENIQVQYNTLLGMIQ
jgi:hypothetical protein